MPKKPPLTPEEKKALKAAKKAEKKRLAELKKIQLRHDHLSREVKYGQLTIKLHEKNWRKMLINISLPRVRQDLQYAWHNFERVIDAKDFIISLLMDEIHDAEQQYMLNLKCHTDNIDNMITRFRDQLEEMKMDSDGQLDLMQASAEKEVEELRTNAADSEEYIKVMLFGLEVAKKEQEKLVRGDYLSKLDEETTKYSDIIQNLRVGLEKTYSKVWEDTKTFLKDYTAQTAERRKSYLALSQQDASLQVLCEEQRLKLFNMQEYIKKLRVRYNSMQETEGQKISDLLQERQYFADAFWTLRTRLTADRALDAANLRVLTVESNESTEHLQEIEKKGEKMLELAAVCRKLETQDEKILPFPVPASNAILSCTSSEIDLDEYKNSVNLQLFWQRVAQADAIRHSINEEREFLKRKNKLLKIKIHNYCQCLDCPIYNCEEPQKKLAGKINIVDGNDVQRNYGKH